MSKIREEAERVIRSYQYLYDDGYALDAEVAAYEQSKRVLVLLGCLENLQGYAPWADRKIGKAIKQAEEVDNEQNDNQSVN